jgi:uncharacterized protein with PIN domain
MPVRFLCDEMLAGLGRWLRLAGYDTAIAGRGRRDRDLVAQAEAEERVLLTRDRRLVEIRAAAGRTILLSGDGIEACAEELARRLGVDWCRDPLSRCALCNEPLRPASRRLMTSLPPRVRGTGSPVRVCRRCRRLYWDGTHVRRIRRRLAGFAEAAASTSPVQQPKDQRQGGADDERRDDRHVDAHVVALEDDVSGQATEPDLGQDRPEQARHDQNDAKDYPDYASFSACRGVVQIRNT